jgi:hypothetical protein
LNSWKKYFCQLLNEHGKGGIRQTEMNTATQSVQAPNTSEAEVPIGKLERHKSPCANEIPVEIFKARVEVLRSEIHKGITLIWNKEELPDRWKE